MTNIHPVVVVKTSIMMFDGAFEESQAINPLIYSPLKTLFELCILALQVIHHTPTNQQLHTPASASED